jgi:hypothetical protein
MKPPPDRFTIFVLCDDPSHAKAQAVTNFVRISVESEAVRLPGHHWDELYPGRRKSGTDSAVTLVDNRRPTPEATMSRDRDYWSRSRAVYELECRKCRKPREFQLEKLFAVFDQIYADWRAAYGDTGVRPVSLRDLDAAFR